MAKPFKGKIALDIRDSTPDWEPYLPPKAPEGAPNVLLHRLGRRRLRDDGRVRRSGRDAEHAAHRGRGREVRELPHDRAVLADARVAADRPQRDDQRHGDDRRVRSGFPGISTRIPFENGFISEVLAEHGYNTYCVGKWHLTPGEECNLAAFKGRWPLGRGFERFYGWLGGETNNWYPDLVHDNHQIDPPATARGRLPPRRRPVRQGDRVHPRREGHRARQAVLHVLRAAGRARAAPRADGVGRQVQGQVRPGLRGDPRRDPGAPDASWGCCPRTPSCRRSTRTASRTRTGPDGQPWPLLDTVRPWDSLSADEQRLFARMAEVFAGYISYYDDQFGRVLDYLEESGQLDNTIIVVISDNGASGEGGPNGSFNEWRFFNGSPTRPTSRSSTSTSSALPQSYNHYNTGWAWAFDTPFPYWKRWAGDEGGVADMCLVSWPAKIKPPRRSSASSTSTRSTSSRRSTTCSASSRPR